MAVLEVLVVLVVAALLVYALLSWLLRATSGHDPRAVAPGAGRWRAAHYERHGQTRVVLQKLSVDGVKVVDEHLVATISPDDPDYETRSSPRCSLLASARLCSSRRRDSHTTRSGGVAGASGPPSVRSTPRPSLERSS